MKTIHLIVFFASLSLFNHSCAQNKEIRLIIRGDDIGFSHAANDACIKSYKDGFMTTVELMVPCPWFPEAVKMLNENPGLDVGVHLVLTSEWENLKWGPVSCSPSLTDENGYFYPRIWKNEDFPSNTALRQADWKIEEIEKEFRAQIELALKKVPHISHLTCHMGCSNWDEKVAVVFSKLAKEYKLDIDLSKYDVQRAKGFEKGEKLSDWEDNFISMLNTLEPGNTYLFVEHPGLDVPEMEAVGHKGYYGVATDRENVTGLFTSQRVKDEIKKLGIKLISYKELAEMGIK